MSRLPRIWYSTSIGLLILALASSAAAGPQREGHAEEAVRYRMSEVALGRLTQIAELRTGVTVLSYEKDNMTGKYFPSYSSSVCPILGGYPVASALCGREAGYRAGTVKAENCG
jgi:hypothetical protein